MADARSARNDNRTEAEEILAEEEAAQAKAEGRAAPDAETDENGKKKKNALPDIPVAARAEISCQADLDRVLADHQRWINAVFDPRMEVAAGRANLKDTDLRGYKLTGVNLSGANLSGANLQGVDLTRANLTVANLQGALLQTAILAGAKLTRAKIDGADLRGADLTGALLTGVDLTKAITRSDDPEVLPEGLPEVLPEALPEVLPEALPEVLPEPLRAGASALDERSVQGASVATDASDEELDDELDAPPLAPGEASEDAGLE